MPNDTRDAQKAVLVVMAVWSSWSRYIARELAASGMKITILTPHAPNSEERSRAAKYASELQELGIATEFFREGRMAPRPLTMALDIRRIARRKGADHILTLYGGNFAVAAWLSFTRPFSVYWVGSDIHEPGLFRKLISRFAFKAATINIANGKNLSTAAEAKFGSPNVFPLYHGIDCDYWSPLPSLRRPNIICTRWFEPIYDNATVLRAGLTIDLSTQDRHLIFSGIGSQLEHCEALAQSSPQKGRITFLKGAYGDDMLAHLRHSTIYVSMSLSDGSSTSLMEAMAVGCFPIVSDIPANREWKENGCDIELIPVGRHDLLSDAIGKILDDHDRLASARELNRAVVINLASIKANIPALAKKIAAASFEIR